MIAFVGYLIMLNYWQLVVYGPPESTWQSALLQIGFHLPLGLMVASYIQCVVVDPGTVPLDFHERVRDTYSLQRSFAYCRKSKMYKPPRAHFCSVQRRLVLNMDHYCPWVTNTIGFFNRKFFLLFVFYAQLSCTYGAAMIVGIFPPSRYMISPFRRNKLFGGSHAHPRLRGASLIHREVEEADRLADETPPWLLMALAVDLSLAVALFFFFLFHLNMVVTNQVLAVVVRSMIAHLF
jgi:palmitoyltransferase